MTNVVPVCTVEEVRDEFRRRGVSVSDWARRKGVSAQLTYRILAGRTVGLRGQSHEIAVRLGLKSGLIGRVTDIDALGSETTHATTVASPHKGDPSKF